MTPALEAVDLVRDFGAVRAVDGISFRLEAGGALALFGPNGAGKSTLLRLLGGALRPSSGAVRIGGGTGGGPEGGSGGGRAEGVDPSGRRPAPAGRSGAERGRGGGDSFPRGRVGVLSHQTFLYGNLTPAENLRLHGTLHGLRDLANRVPERLRAVGLAARADDPVQALSRGMKQRLALARTLLHDPEIVLLDEPYTGLDVHAATVLRDVLGGLRDGRRTLVVVTHDLTRGLELADTVAIQVRGRFAFCGPRAEVAPGFEGFYREVVEASA